MRTIASSGILSYTPSNEALFSAVTAEFSQLPSPAAHDGAGASVDPAALRLELREATAEAHAALDTRFADVAGSLASYHAFVRMNHACHVALEGWLAPILPAGAHGRRPVLVAPLAADMEAMGLEPAPSPEIDLEPALPEAAGVLYVLDGSRLGARFIQRALAARAQTGDTALSAHYVTEAARPGAVFAALNHVAAKVGAHEVGRAVSAANATFTLFLKTSEAVTA